MGRDSRSDIVIKSTKGQGTEVFVTLPPTQEDPDAS